MANVDINEITPEIIEYAGMCSKSGAINPELYTKYDVKRGLRDINGKGCCGWADPHFGYYFVKGG